MDDEDITRPLIVRFGSSTDNRLGNHHDQFCRLVGVRPLSCPDETPYRPHPQSLYVRATKRRKGQSCTYMVTATLVNTLLLTQVVLGAALTGLGASNSSRILITIFGALNTVIAGVVAFLKSRGQPMRARMFRDDLSRVVDEIENSAVMWYGISQGAHGYGAIDTDTEVTVRGEVARLTRLYDKAVKANTINDPDMYSANGVGDSFSAGLRKDRGGRVIAPPGPAVSSTAVARPPDSSPNAQLALPTSAAAAAADDDDDDEDDSPASKAPEPKPKIDADSDKDSVKHEACKTAQDAPTKAASGSLVQGAEPGKSDASDETFASVVAANPRASTPAPANHADDSPASAAAAPGELKAPKKTFVDEK